MGKPHGVVLLSEALTASLFNYGAFNALDTRMVGYALTAMSIGIPGFMLSKVLLPAFYARQDTKTPVRVGLIALGINMALKIGAAYVPMDEAHPAVPSTPYASPNPLLTSC